MRAVIVLWLACLVFAPAAEAAPAIGPGSGKYVKAKAFRKAFPLSAQALAARQAIERAEARFAELARDGASATVQALPDGQILMLGRNDFLLDQQPRVREVRPNYQAVGFADHWCYLRTAETNWICERPNTLGMRLIDIDWQAQISGKVESEDCGDQACLRIFVAAHGHDGGVGRKRKFRVDSDLGGLGVQLLVRAEDYAPVELLRTSRLSPARTASLSMRFDLDARIEPIIDPEATR